MEDNHRVNENDPAYLRQVIEDLLYQRDVVKQRVTIAIRELIFENDALKQRIGELEMKLKESNDNSVPPGTPNNSNKPGKIMRVFSMGEKTNNYSNTQPLTPQPLGINSPNGTAPSNNTNNNGTSANGSNAEPPLKRKPSVSSLIKKGMLRGNSAVDSSGGTNLREVGLPKIGGTTPTPTPLSPNQSANNGQTGTLTSSSSTNGTSKPPFNLRGSQTTDNSNVNNNNNNNANTGATQTGTSGMFSSKKTPLKDKVTSFVSSFGLVKAKSRGDGEDGDDISSSRYDSGVFTNLPTNNNSNGEDEDNTPEFDEVDSEDLVFVRHEGSAMPVVKAGTVDKLVERLVPEKYPDPDYMKHFLLTYRSFTNPELVIKRLGEKYKEAKPIPGQDDENKNRVTRRIRVLNVFKTWMGSYHAFDIEALDTKKLLSEVIPHMISDGGASLQMAYDKFLTGSIDIVQPTGIPPKPLLLPQPSDRKLELTDFDPQELARQITLYEFDLFSRIVPTECLGQAWNRTGKESKAPNVLKMVHWSNDISAWVWTEVLKGSNPKARADIIKFFVRIAKHCRELNNFNAIVEILAGLHNAAIDRMKKTWEKADRLTQAAMRSLMEETACEKNYQKLRDILKLSLPPCIPYLGMFLTDLTFIDTGNKDFQISTLNPNLKLINFTKLRKTATVIHQLQGFQKTPYCLEKVAEVHKYLEGVMAGNITDGEAYKVSLAQEPREPSEN